MRHSSRRLLHAVRAPLVVASFCTAATGCLSYRTVASENTRAGEEVRLTLAEQGAADLARLVGPRASALDGRVVARTDSGVTLAVQTIVRVNGAEESWPGEPIAVPRGAIGSVQKRRVDRGRTALIVAGIIGLGVAVSALFTTAEDVSRPGQRPPGSGQ